MVPQVKVIQINPLDDSKSGVFGEYHVLGDGKGVKVITGSDDDDYVTIPQSGLYSTIEELLNSRCWAEATKEAEFIQTLSDSGYTPKFYEMVVVQYNEEDEDVFYLPGIVMEHICGDVLEDLNLDDDKQYDIELMFRQWVKRDYNLRMCDIHCGNVIARNGDMSDLVLIDFSPTYTCVEEVAV